MRLITLIADLPLVNPNLAPAAGYTIRPFHESDIPDLARLQFASYDPGIAYDTIDEALLDYETNLPARSLYESLGFEPWRPQSPEET